ncbi:uncharacterized protein LOC116071063 [Mastomys coucha]|uniref:uncharacterized protein LOC116071063 n=1 Tax=Mastomys coucha TaxID=35658 RepID=UPI00126264F0|nr:uncharacterized protein LOC116071063 [Mastomys coucha]
MERSGCARLFPPGRRSRREAPRALIPPSAPPALRLSPHTRRTPRRSRWPPSLSSSVQPPRPGSTPCARSPTPPSPDLCQRPEGKRAARRRGGSRAFSSEKDSETYYREERSLGVMVYNSTSKTQAGRFLGVRRQPERLLEPRFPMSKEMGARSEKQVKKDTQLKFGIALRTRSSDGSAVKSTCNSCRGHRFNSQHGAHNHLYPVPGHSRPSSNFCGHHTHS